MSVVVVATIVPIPEHRDAVIAALVAAIPVVHEEDGCEFYALHEGEDRLVMVEKWASLDALNVHGEGPALQRVGAALADKLVAPLDVQVLHAHPAGTPEKGAL
jgi:quinol monooxygenase YgiN